MKKAYLFYHGYGFDQTFWKPYLPGCSPESDFLFFDRGYYGKPQELVMDREYSKIIIVAHSLGLHFVKKAYLREADLIITIGSFIDFLAYRTISKEATRRLIALMKVQAVQDISSMLYDFHQACFFPEKPIQPKSKQCILDLLIQDLNLLLDKKDSLFFQEELRGKILGFWGLEDRILAPEAKKLFQEITECTSVGLSGVGHAFSGRAIEEFWERVHEDHRA